MSTTEEQLLVASKAFERIADGLMIVDAHRRIITYGWPLMILLVGGCAEELGREKRETTRVTGLVLEGKRPIGKGWIEFVPIEGTVGNMRSAPLRPDGRFVAEGVAVGVNRVGIAGARISIPRARRFFDPLGSPIRRLIPKTESEPLVIDLIDEIATQTPVPHGN